MTLIDSDTFHTFAITVGTLVFLSIVLWAVWFAFRMD
ncbi:delta-aminolevulinic acid dehydratase [Cyanobacterium sp. uoEpiScrs1]|nr:delta-aminolevulinic acid dehydratase [Cyanobacterium sp. uoEpiScrs1]